MSPFSLNDLPRRDSEVPPPQDAESGPRLLGGPPAAPSFASPASFAFAPGEKADDAADLIPEWPAPLQEAALIGPAGDFVRVVGPETEADPVALLLQFLVAFGNVIGRKAHFDAEADHHFANLNAVVVGMTAKGRKGTSWGYVKKLMARIDPHWVERRLGSGLSSGEGLIWHVRDPVEKKEPTRKKKLVTGYQPVVVDHGVEDKRLLDVEGEFALVLRVFAREGNTLSAVIRNAWDNGRLETLVKNNPATATNAHISIIGHITKSELLRYMNETEAANGFGNRMIWICVRRARSLPRGGTVPADAFERVVSSVRGAVEFASKAGRLQRDEDAETLWTQVYDRLSEGRAGVLGALLGRAEAQVMRLALIYALLDRATVIGVRHLSAALAVWRYAEDSVRYIFGDSLGDPVADTILRALREAPEGLSRTELFKRSKNHTTAASLNQALATLLELGLVERKSVRTSGRNAEIWFARAANAKEANDANEGGGQRMPLLSYAPPPAEWDLRSLALRSSVEEVGAMARSTGSAATAAAGAADRTEPADAHQPTPSGSDAVARFNAAEANPEAERGAPDDSDRPVYDTEPEDDDRPPDEDWPVAPDEGSDEGIIEAPSVSITATSPVEPEVAPPPSPRPQPSAAAVVPDAGPPVSTRPPDEPAVTLEDLIARRGALTDRWSDLTKTLDHHAANKLGSSPRHWAEENHLGDWKSPTPAMLDAMEQFIAAHEPKAVPS